MIVFLIYEEVLERKGLISLWVDLHGLMFVQSIVIENN